MIAMQGLQTSTLGFGCALGALGCAYQSLSSFSKHLTHAEEKRELLPVAIAEVASWAIAAVGLAYASVQILDPNQIFSREGFEQTANFSSRESNANFSTSSDQKQNGNEILDKVYQTLPSVEQTFSTLKEYAPLGLGLYLAYSLRKISLNQQTILTRLTQQDSVIGKLQQELGHIKEAGISLSARVTQNRNELDSLRISVENCVYNFNLLFSYQIQALLTSTEGVTEDGYPPESYFSPPPSTRTPWQSAPHSMPSSRMRGSSDLSSERQRAALTQLLRCFRIGQPPSPLMSPLTSFGSEDRHNSFDDGE